MIIFGQQKHPGTLITGVKTRLRVSCPTLIAKQRKTSVILSKETQAPAGEYHRFACASSI